MLNTQNLTPKQLSAFTALVLASSVAIGIYFLTVQLELWIGVAPDRIHRVISSYSVDRSKNSSNRKIKLIYKFIHQTKATQERRSLFQIYSSQKKY